MVIVFVNVNTYEVCYIYKGPYNDREVPQKEREPNSRPIMTSTRSKKWKQQSYIS